MYLVRSRIGQVAVMAAFAMGVLATTAAAQAITPWTGKGFVNVNFGSQTKARTQTMGDSFPLYDETATWETSIGVGSSSIVDISGGIRIWQNFAVGIGVTTYSDDTGATVSASIPDPLFFDRPTASSLDITGLEHKERAVHLSAVYVIPVMNRLDISVFAGPSFFNLKKDLVTDVSVPTNGTTISGATRSSIERSVTGGHVGFDISYAVLQKLANVVDLGVGAFVRYGQAKVDAPEVNEGKIEVGGLNYGAGLRIKF